MPSDRSLRPSRSFLPYPSYAGPSSAPSCRPRPSLDVVATSHIQPSLYEPHQLSLWGPVEDISVAPQIQINSLHPTHAAPQPHLATANVAIPQPPVSPPSAHFYPALSESGNQDYLNALAHHSLYHPEHRHAQVEQATEPGVPLRPPSPSLLVGNQNYVPPLSSIQSQYQKEYCPSAPPTQPNDLISSSYVMPPCADMSVTRGPEREPLTSQQRPVGFHV
jgi:hypothetical protein